jgi:ribulose bisphosphate carboxylase small subunit
MKRSILAGRVRHLAGVLNQEPWEFWEHIDFPHAYQESTGEGESDLNVEWSLLEDTLEYIHVGIAVDDGGWLSGHWPVTTSIIIRKPNDNKSRGPLNTESSAYGVSAYGVRA